MFSFETKTDKELDEIRFGKLLGDGIYSFTVDKIEHYESAAGNKSLKVTLKILDSNEEPHFIDDYLPARGKMIFKTKHFCQTIGFDAEYEKGTFDPQTALRRRGLVLIGTQKGNAMPDGSGYYRDKNNVKDYVKEDINPHAPKSDFIDDDIKFC